MALRRLAHIISQQLVGAIGLTLIPGVGLEVSTANVRVCHASSCFLGEYLLVGPSCSQTVQILLGSITAIA
jgi:hypothetical protein